MRRSYVRPPMWMQKKLHIC